MSSQIMDAIEMTPSSNGITGTIKVDEAVPVTVEYSNGSDDRMFKFSMRRLLAFAGPGLLMSIAYVDPGNLESDLQTGARTGYTFGWLILWSTALGFLVQLLAMRLGIVTHKHLAEHCRDVYPTGPRIIIWLMVEAAIIGSDIQEVIGSAIAIQLLTERLPNGPVPLWGGVLITGVDTFALLYLERLGVRKLEAFFGVLVATMTLSFGVMYHRAGADTGKLVVGTLLPTMEFNGTQLSTAAGIVGALVMPHNIFLHSALVQSRKIDTSHVGAQREAILYNAIESGLSLAITVVINLFVMAVFAAGLHGNPEAHDVGLSTAGSFLGERFGEPMKIIWAIGLFAAGQSSTMTGTYTGQFVMSGFMDLQVSPWMRALITRSVALVPTLLFAITYAHTNKLDDVNEDLNVLQSFQLPFALLPVLYVSTREDIMGTFVTRAHFKRMVQVVCSVLLILNLTTAVLAAGTLLNSSAIAAVFTAVSLSLYFASVVYLMVGPVKVQHALERIDHPAVWRCCGWLGRGKGLQAVPAQDEAAAAPDSVLLQQMDDGRVTHTLTDDPLDEV